MYRPLKDVGVVVVVAVKRSGMAEISRSPARWKRGGDLLSSRCRRNTTKHNKLFRIGQDAQYQYRRYNAHAKGYDM